MKRNNPVSPEDRARLMIDPEDAWRGGGVPAFWRMDVALELLATGEHTLDNIAQAAGVTREAIRSRLQYHFPGEGPAAIKAGTARRKAAREAEIREQKRKRARTAAAAPHHFTSDAAFSVEDCLEAIRRCYKVRGRARGLSHGDYMKLRKHPDEPTPATIIKHFDGSWTAACKAAGIPQLPRVSDTRVYVRHSYEDCVTAVMRCILELRHEHGEFYSVGAGKYAKWAEGKDDVPCLATVRNRARPAMWRDVLNDALGRLYGD